MTFSAVSHLDEDPWLPGPPAPRTAPKSGSVRIDVDLSQLQSGKMGDSTHPRNDENSREEEDKIFSGSLLIVNVPVTTYKNGLLSNFSTYKVENIKLLTFF